MSITSNCIVCNKELSPEALQRQGMYGTSVTLQTCSSGCRSKHYHNMQHRKHIDVALKTNNLSLIQHLQISKLLELGYKVIVSK